MEEINLKAELQEERENLIWTLNAIRNNPDIYHCIYGDESLYENL